MERNVFSRLLSGIRRLLKQRAGAPGEQHVGDMADDVDSLKEKVSQGKLPVHVGIIMDGNGRWAKRRGLPPVSYTHLLLTNHSAL